MSDTQKNRRLQPLEADEVLVLTDRQAEDHAQNVRGEEQPEVDPEDDEDDD